MFRLNKVVDGSHITFVIDGQLSAEHVSTVEHCCRQALSEDRPVQLLLNNVLTVDEAGRDMLCRLARVGIKLSGNGVYTSYLLQQVEALRDIRRHVSPGGERSS